MSELIKRRDAVQATINHFRNSAFEYGRHDCAILVNHCLQQLGHKDQLTKIGQYTDAASAYRAMKRRHIKSFESHLDKLGFQRIAPAFAIAGDVVTLPSGDERFPVLGIHAGNDTVITWNHLGQLSVGPYIAAIQAWHVTVLV